MKPAVLFDLDGTLTDSSLGIFRCFRHAFARLAETGGPQIALPADDAALRFLVGPPLRESFSRFAGEAHKETLMAFYLERYSPIGAFENRVYDGVVAALDTLRDAGARLFVATSKSETDARAIVAHFGLIDRFESVNGARKDGSRAIKREIISDILSTHGIEAGNAVMIGDREFDMIGARETGLYGVGALWGYGGAEELRAAGAAALAETPAEAAALALRR